MPPTTSRLLAEMLNGFATILSGGLARSIPEVMWWLQQMATLELIIAALVWAHRRDDWMWGLVWKIIGFTFLIFFVENWQQLSDWLGIGFIEAGLLIGDNVLTVADFKDPGNIVDFGFSVTALLITNLNKMSWWNYSFAILWGGFGGIAIVLCYIWLAKNVFMALVEYYIVTACLIFLVPFLAYEKTAPFGERVFGTFVAHATRLLIYAAVLSVVLPILYKYQLPLEPTFAHCMRLLAGSLIAMALAISSAEMARALIAGTPALSFSNLIHGGASLMQTMAAVGAIGAAASLAGAAGLRGAVSGAGAIRAAAQQGTANWRTANPFTHASRSGNRRAMLIGGAQGIGAYAAQRLTSGFRAAWHQGRTRAQNRP